MILREFIYFNNEDQDQQEEKRYDPTQDKSILSIKDTRKTRLTLKMIKNLRQAAESREQESNSEMSFIRKMYANPPADQMPPQ